MKLSSIPQSRIYGIVIGFLIVITIVVSMQSYSGGTEIKSSALRTHYSNYLNFKTSATLLYHDLDFYYLHSYFNNYLIFKTSATHLFQGLDLYILHPDDHFDLYKYSPFFAMLMAPFTVLPDWLGLILWNLLNLSLLVIGLKSLPKLSKKQVSIILLIGLFELIGSIMNEQSNALMTGLMVLSIAKFEKGNTLWGTFFLMLSVYIKLFSIVLFMMLLFYPKKLRTILYSALWLILFALIPAVAVGVDGLIDTYKSWFNMLQNDYDNSVGFSVVGVMVRWFNYQGSRTLVFLIGVIIMIIPLIKISYYSIRKFRYLVLSAILIWIIIFNHKAESPTFIIAMTGIGLYFMTQKFTLSNKILLAFVIIFVSLVYSDLMPKGPRDNFFHAYFIKAVPCIVIWLKIIYELTFTKLSDPLDSKENHSILT